MLAVSELIRYGPMSAAEEIAVVVEASAAAKIDGGLVAASASWCNEVSTIQATGAKKISVTHPGARPPSTGPAIAARLGLGARVAGRAGWSSATIGLRLVRRGGHREISSVNSDEMVRRANVATTIVPITDDDAGGGGLAVLVLAEHGQVDLVRQVGRGGPGPPWVIVKIASKVCRT